MKDLTLPARLAMADENPDTREAKLRSVRRRLFVDDANDKGAPSKEDIEKQFAKERDQHLEEKKTKWNFDFKEERPLDGQWQWERLDMSDSSGSASAAKDAPENADATAQRTDGDAQKQGP